MEGRAVELCGNFVEDFTRQGPEALKRALRHAKEEENGSSL